MGALFDCCRKKKIEQETSKKSKLTEPLNRSQISLDTEEEGVKTQTNKDSVISVPSSKNESGFESTDNGTELNIWNFSIVKTLGMGAYGKVVLVSKNKVKENKIFAMKIISKAEVKKNKHQENIRTERDILALIDHPFVLKLVYSFQNYQFLYLLTEFVQGGELNFYLREKGQFKETWIKFYAAELILALECLHRNNYIYRDLKPENILIDSEGHIRLIDFGLSKKVVLKSEELDKDTMNYSICGTAEYLAPEVLDESGYDKSIDFWSLGILIYELLTGSTPFKSRAKSIDPLMYKKPIEMKSYFSDAIISLLEGLLNLDPEKRLGYGPNGADNIKKHFFFKGIDWKMIYKKEITPPIIPSLANEYDVSKFSHSSVFLEHSNSIRSRNTTEAGETSFSQITYNALNDPEYYENFNFTRETKEVNNED